MLGTWIGRQPWFQSWLSHPQWDWLLVLVLGGGHFAYVQLTGSGDLLGAPGREQRLDIYTTTATVVAITGGFITAAISQYAASSGRRMRELRTRRELGHQFRRNWVSVLSATLLIAAVCLLASALDTTDTDPGGVHWMVEAALLLGVARSVRLLRLFDDVILASDKDLAEQTRRQWQADDTVDR